MIGRKRRFGRNGIILASLLILSAMPLTGTRLASDHMTVIRAQNPGFELETAGRMAAQFRYGIERVIRVFLIAWAGFLIGLMVPMGLISAIAGLRATAREVKHIQSGAQAAAETALSPACSTEAVLEPARKNA